MKPPNEKRNKQKRNKGEIERKKETNKQTNKQTNNYKIERKKEFWRNKAITNIQINS